MVITGPQPATLARKLQVAPLKALPARAVPLSWVDRLSMSEEKIQLAQSYYDVNRELAQRVLGDSEGFQYRSNPGLTNADQVAALWGLQARYGHPAATLASLPATLVTGLAGTLAGTPIEGASIESHRITHVVATGHGLNPLLNLVSATALAAAALGVAGNYGSLLAGAALAGPLLTLAPLIPQRFGEENAPVHEMAHAMQFLLLGDLMQHGVLNERDALAVQNHQHATGYLWGGDTEAAAHQAETGGDPSQLFQVIEKRCTERIQDCYPVQAPQRLKMMRGILDGHRSWITQRLDLAEAVEQRKLRDGVQLAGRVQTSFQLHHGSAGVRGQPHGV